MSSSSDASLGFWTDYNVGFWDQWQILATDYWAQWMSAFVAVCLTLANPYVFRIVVSILTWPIHGFGWLQEKWKHSNERSALSQPHALAETRPLLSSESANDDERRQSSANLAQPESSPNARAAQTPMSSQIQPSLHASNRISWGQLQPTRNTESPAHILTRSSDSREAVAQFIQMLRHKGTGLSQKAFVVVLMTALFGLFVAEVIAGIFSAQIASDRAALSSSKHCGIWEVDYDVGDEISYRSDLHSYGKEARASQYARNCYHLPNPTDSVGCNFFYNQSISFVTQTEQQCPFISPELCSNGLYSAAAFDTGYVDAGVIGINSPTSYKFRRKSSCSPLNMSEPYVRGEHSQDPNNATYRYYYGHKDNWNFTFETSGNPFNWLVPTYSANAYFSSLYPDSDYWEPLPNLKPSPDSTLTIIFIASNHIYHEEASFDPMFPATKPRYFPHERKPYYYNSDPRARVLACVDTTELCSPDGKTCWNMTASLPHQFPDIPAYWFMKWSLENSNTYESIKWRLGTALLAQESISQSVSKPLPSNQWELEASQLFATSLARIQYDAWGIARGEDREQPGYVEVTPAEAQGRLCRLYKFNSVGYTNINLLGFIGLPLAAIAVWILSWEITTHAVKSGATAVVISSSNADTNGVVIGVAPAATTGNTSEATTENRIGDTTQGSITDGSLGVVPNTTTGTHSGHGRNESHGSSPMIIDIIAKFIGIGILDLIVGIYRCSVWAGRAFPYLWEKRRSLWEN